MDEIPAKRENENDPTYEGVDYEVGGRIVLPDELAEEEAAARSEWLQAHLPHFGAAILIAALGYILLRRILK